MISRDMSLQFKEVSPHIIDVDKRKLLMNVVLSDVNVKVVIAVLI